MQFLAVDLQCDCCCLQWPSFWIFVPVNRGLRLLKMLAGPLRLMDVTLSKRNWSYMRYWYFVDFRRGISVLPIFLTVLRYWVPPSPPPSVPLFKIWINLKLKRTLKSFHSYKCICQSWSVFGPFHRPKMTEFPTLSYTLTSEIPNFSNLRSGPILAVLIHSL